MTTKKRLIRSACTVFAAKGYRDATVAEICESAEANIASVNYHFGDKSNLYYACFMHLFGVVERTYPEPETTDPETWLHAFVRTRILNILDDGEAGLLPKLMHLEMGQPTEIHGRLFDDAIRPRHKRIVEMIGIFLGEDTDPVAIQVAAANFTSLHIFMNIGKQQAGKPGPFEQDRPIGKSECSKMANQVAAFAMGGLHATRAHLNQQRNPS
ncbi:MAG: CerR family C-terminal domain-containing protein [Pontiellaceae bacterium]|nr:CerR family C-terminal domain-containing protein [Pontiellaceae bacterium]MBN2785033.1 CerR family C-terminal domain-containing protein [Pontiellaceae bacterium]